VVASRFTEFSTFEKEISTMGEIKLSGPQAQGTLNKLDSSLENFLKQINNLCNDFNEINSVTKSTPISQGLSTAATAMNEMGTGVRASVDSFGTALVQVVNKWNEIHATAAGKVSQSTPAFSKVDVPAVAAGVVNVDPQKLYALVDKTNHLLGLMNNEYDTMNTSIMGSESYWTGSSANQSRATWTTKIKPLQEKVNTAVKAATKLVTAMADQIVAFDKGTYVSG